jgi:inosose dehydratase
MLLERMDTSLLGLCFDTGHCAFGGGDPLALLREAGELVNHVHFKDVDLELLARLQKEGKGLEDAWEAGVFCPLGTGEARVDDCLRQLLASGYDAWIVVEQDRVLAPGEPFENALESAERNRAWLKERGL